MPFAKILVNYVKLKANPLTLRFGMTFSLVKRKDRLASIGRVKDSLIMERVSNEENRILTLSTHVMRSIVERNGGTFEKDPLTGKIEITVPGENKDACTEEIGELLAIIQVYMVTSFIALRDGKVIVWGCCN